MSNGNGNGKKSGPLSSLSDAPIGDALIYGFFFAAGTALFGLVSGLFTGGSDDEGDVDEGDEE